MKLNKIKSVHFTGIKGVGLTSLALCAQDLKIKVSGSDLAGQFVTAPILESRHIKPQVGFALSHLPANTDLLIYTAAHQGQDNPEVKGAKQKGITCLNHGQALALFMQAKTGIAVCGVGGKSTTTAMIATILETAGLNPSFAVGVGNIPALNTPAQYNKSGKYFITEADEYLKKFLKLKPNIIVATNVEFDHPDVYQDFTATQKAYAKFFNLLPKDGLLVANADNPNTLKLAKESGKKLLTYGTHPQADFKITHLHTADQKTLLTLIYRGVDQQYVLKVPGQFNALNASAAIAVATHIGIDPKLIAKGVKNFTGTIRRFQLLGTTKFGVTIVDDYAHHPSQIKATLKASKDWFPGKRIIVIFQPHTYSRTQALFKEFSQSFSFADQVILLPIYASAREAKNDKISSPMLQQAIAKFHANVVFKPDYGSLLEYLKPAVNSADVILTLGAGNVAALGTKLLKDL